MKFVSIATRSSPRLVLLKSSCAHNGIDLEILGEGEPYPGNGTKIKLLCDYLERLAPDEVVLYLDAYDTVFLAGSEEIEEKFRALGHPVVFSAEQNCSVNGSAWLRFDAWRRYPRFRKPYRYINAGSLIGEAKPMLEALRRANIPPAAKSDQSLLHLFFVANPDVFSLDDRHTIFTCTAGRTGLEMDDYAVEGDRLRNRITGTLPCVLHCPGKNYYGLERLTAKLPFERAPYIPTRAEIRENRRSRRWNWVTARLGQDNYIFHFALQATGVLAAIGLAIGLVIAALL